MAGTFRVIRTYITQIDGKWYAFEGNVYSNEVWSIGHDSIGRTVWFAKWTDNGIKYVAKSCPTRNAAYQKARRWGTYGGEV